MAEFSLDCERDGEKFKSKAYRCRFLPAHRRASSRKKKSKSTLELNLFLAAVRDPSFPRPHLVFLFFFFSSRENIARESSPLLEQALTVIGSFLERKSRRRGPRPKGIICHDRPQTLRGYSLVTRCHINECETD